MESRLAAWVLLGISVASEVVGTIALKQSDGFARLTPAILAGTCYVLAVWLMSVSMKQLEMGITYAVWAGSGTALTALVGIAVFGESTNTPKLAGLAFVVAGLALMGLGSGRA
jgi:small multidrug resistance pump